MMVHKYAILVLLHLLPLALPDHYSTTTTIHATAKPGCETKCGNVTIQYPFGIGINSGCSINPSFAVACDRSTPKLSVPSGNLEIIEISSDHVRIKNQVATRCYSADGNITRDNNYMAIDLTSTPYSISDANLFTVVGCDDGGVINSYTKVHKELTMGCSSHCLSRNEVIDGSCFGMGCCQTPLPKGLKSVHAWLYTYLNHTRIHSFDPCGYAFLGDRNRFQFRSSDFQEADFQNRTIENVPLVLDWAIGNETCDQAKKSGDLACKDHTFCNDSDSGLGGYRCYCLEGFQGNPYLPPGCTDIDECENNPCSENGICTNVPGSYSCSCRRGYKGDGRKKGFGCITWRFNFPEKLSLGITFGLILVLVAIKWLYFGIKKRRLSKMREKFFRQNGGLFLKQQTSFIESGVEPTKIFSAEELEKATNGFTEGRVLGRGGCGTVYKGTLPYQRVVAIKKSRIMDKSQIEPFINEVIILTQINHRNVVKLLGCCLETEIPLLVYEFISNGTLYDHIHNRDESSRLPWKDRLRIAAEAAGALAYLHSAASVPVIHRDVKLSNILLDHSYTAKLSDFGVSRLIPLDQTPVTTLVQGTLGYLDPEYFHTSQSTVKSDVYSFGVVLAELMTGKKPLLPTNSEDERNLASYFIKYITENRFCEILDPQILREYCLEQLQPVGDLVKSCLNLKGDERPTMKEVSLELERFSRHTNEATSGEQSSFSSNSNSINLSSNDFFTQSTDLT